MSPFDEFRHLATLLGIVEKLGSPNRVQTLTFRDTAGQVVGRLTLDSGMVRFGVIIEGQSGVDEAFLREAVPYAEVLQRLVLRAPLETAEIQRLEGMPLLLRRVFRSLTARTLRRLAPRCDAARIEVQVAGEGEVAPSALYRVLDYAFPPVELLLTAGRTGTLRYADTAARIYETPPNLAEQRWLFEWQAEDTDCPWPVMASRQAEIKIAAVAQVGTLGHSLSRYLSVTRKPDGPRRLRAQIVSSDGYVYYLVSTQEYLALIVYQLDQLGRVVKSLEELLAATSEADAVPASANLAAGRSPTSSSSKVSPVVTAVTGPTRRTAEVAPVGAPQSTPRTAVPATAAVASRSVAKAAAAPLVTGKPDRPSKHSPPGDSDAQLRPALPAATPVRPPAEPAARPPGEAEEWLTAASWVETVALVAALPALAEPTPPPAAEAAAPPVAVTAVPPAAVTAAPPALSPPSAVAPIVEVAAIAEVVPTAQVAAMVEVAPTPLSPSSGSVVPAGAADSLLPTFDSPAIDAALLPGPAPLAARAAAPADAVLPGDLREGPAGQPVTELDPGEGPTADFPIPVGLVSLALRPQLQLELALYRPGERLPLPLPAKSPALAVRSAPEPPPAQPVAAAAPVRASTDRASTDRASAVASLADPIPAGEEPLLHLCNFSARVDGRTILKDLDLKLGRHGVYALMGPGGSGKSSLLGILSGRNRAGTGWLLSGEIVYNGSQLGAVTRPAAVGQRISRPAISLRRYLLEYIDYPDQERDKQRIVQILSHCQLGRYGDSLDAVLGTPPLRLSPGEWWRLAIARELLADPPLLCVDEPTAGLGDSEAEAVVALLQAEGRRRAVLFVSHHQQHVRACSDYVILLAAGQLQEYLPTEDFFARPRSQAARDYVRTGGCAVPSPDAKAEDLALDPAVEAPPEYAQVPVAPRSAPESAPPAPVAAIERVVAPASGPVAAVAAPDPEAPAVALAPPVTPAAVAAPVAEGDLVTPGVLWQDSAPVLQLRGFGVAFGTHSVIADLNLDIAARGIHLLVIPDGTQKRLLLRALCGPQSSLIHCSGQATYQGNRLADGNAPALAAPDIRLMNRPVGEYLLAKLPSRGHSTREEQREQATQLAQQAGFPALASCLDQLVSDLELPERRALDMLSAVSCGPALLCLDEPLSQLPADHQERLLALLLHLAKQRALFILAQDPSPFVRAGGQSPLAIGFCIDGVLSTQPVRAQPQPGLAPEPEVRPAPADPEEPAHLGRSPPDRAGETAAPPEPGAREPAPSSGAFTGGSGPRGFQWLREGALAGMPAPGVSADLEYDLQLIRSSGVTCLVTLTTTPLPAEVVREQGLASVFFPIEDMGAPALAAAVALCDQITEWLADGQVVGFHCKAGYGRTGTMLASQLIWEGADAKTALAKVRAVDPNWVQSDTQEKFLSELAQWQKDNRGSRQLAPKRVEGREPSP